MSFKKKITLMLILFFCGCVFAAFLWHKIEGDWLQNADIARHGIEGLFLYILGYSEEGATTSKVIAAVTSIVALAFLSSILTVYYFWKSCISLDSVLFIEKGKMGRIYIKNKVFRDIFNVKVAATLYRPGEDALTDYHELTILPKRVDSGADFDVGGRSALGQFWESLQSEDAKQGIKFYIVVSYNDGGQDFIFHKQYVFADSSKKTRLKKHSKMGTIIYTDIPLEPTKWYFEGLFRGSEALHEVWPVKTKRYCKYLKSKIDKLRGADYGHVDEASYELVLLDEFEIAEIDMSRGEPICAENIDVEFSQRKIRSIVKFNPRAHYDDFGMALIRRPLGGDLTDFYDMDKNAYLSFDIYVSKGFKVCLELKELKNGVLRPLGERFVRVFTATNGKYTQFSYKLHNLPRESWKGVEELCFTAFWQDTPIQGGEFRVTNCRIIYKKGA